MPSQPPDPFPPPSDPDYPPSPESPNSNESEDPYEYVEGLGEGGFSFVDKVYKRSSGPWAEYARKQFKVPSTSQKDRESTLRKIDEEVHILQKLKFRHVVNIIEFYEWNNKIFVIMSPAADCNLDTFLRDTDKMEPGPERDERRKLLLKRSGCLVATMDYLYSERVKHRDIKPSNILIKGEQIYLTDFGISSMVPTNETTGSRGDAGPRSINYCAPEVLNEPEARRGRAADIFSLGCVLLEMCTVIVAPPRSHELFIRHRRLNERDGRLAYGYNAKQIIQWIIYLWAQRAQLARKDDDNELESLGVPLAGVAFLMLDPDPQARITTLELTRMMTDPEYYGKRVREMCCSMCQHVFTADHSQQPLHSKFKDTADLEIVSVEDALKVSPVPDWESAKRKWLRSHLPWQSNRLSSSLSEFHVDGLDRI